MDISVFVSSPLRIAGTVVFVGLTLYGAKYVFTGVVGGIRLIVEDIRASRRAPNE